MFGGRRVKGRSVPERLREAFRLLQDSLDSGDWRVARDSAITVRDLIDRSGGVFPRDLPQLQLPERMPGFVFEAVAPIVRSGR